MSTIVEATQLGKTFTRRVRGGGLGGLLRAWMRPTLQTVQAVHDFSLRMEEGLTCKR